MLIKNYDKIDIGYELTRRRGENESLHYARQAEVYEKLPEVEKIDKRIHEIGFSEMRSRLRGFSKNESAPGEIAALKERKSELLRGAGYPEDYLDPIYTCKKCFDYGEVDGAVCDCVKEIRIKELYKRSNLSNIFEKENFGTFDESLYKDEPFEGYKHTPFENIKSIRKKAEGYVQSFDEKHGNLLIYGSPGLGKTFITNCIAKALLDSGHTVLYLSANEFFNDVIAEYIINKNREGAVCDIYNYIYDSDLLIIDDLGTEGKNSFFASQLFEVINKRMISQKSVIITTNYSMRDIENFYSERVASRISDQYEFYPLYGDDIRDARRHRQG